MQCRLAARMRWVQCAGVTIKDADGADTAVVHTCYCRPELTSHGQCVCGHYVRASERQVRRGA